jgi:hypothetical protein
MFAASALFGVMMRFGSNHVEGGIEDLLRQLPGVVSVEVMVYADQPAHRIVHLRDWHFVPRDLFALDNPDGSYAEFLQQVDAVQQEQMVVLRCLIKDHGLRRVFAEGLTPENGSRRCGTWRRRKSQNSVSCW